jgi:hypothetical protein
VIAEAIRARARRRKLQQGMLGLAAAAAVVAGFIGTMELLRVPSEGLEVEAAHLALVTRGDASVAVSKGSRLEVGARVETTSGGSVRMRFATGSEVWLDQQSALELLSTGVDQNLRLSEGRVLAEVAHLAAGHRFRIVTPDTELEVRGTRFVVEWLGKAPCPGQAATRLRVEEGIVWIRHGHESAEIHAGQTWPAACAPAATTAPLSKVEIEPVPTVTALPPSRLAEENRRFGEVLQARQAGARCVPARFSPRTPRGRRCRRGTALGCRSGSRAGAACGAGVPETVSSWVRAVARGRARRTAAMIRSSVFAVILLTGCSQAFRFTDDAGPVDAGPGDAGPVDAGSADAGPPCLLPGECECQTDGACPGLRPHCTGDHRCVECTVAADCGVNGLCHANSRCITRCAQPSECTVGIRNKCEDMHCTACEVSTQCAAPTAVCAESVGYCVECATDAQCAAPTPRCDRRFGKCVECLTSAQCAATEYCVTASGVCQPRP